MQLDSLALKTERKKHRRRHFSLTTRYRSRSSYKNGVSVLAGVQEAVTLLHLSNAERLTRCIYVGPLTSNCTEHVLAHKTHLQKYPSTQTTRRVFKCFRKGNCHDFISEYLILLSICLMAIIVLPIDINVLLEHSSICDRYRIIVYSLYHMDLCLKEIFTPKEPMCLWFGSVD